MLTQALERASARRRLPDKETRRLLRKRAGISQAALARALGVDPATVCRWETGDREPDDQRLSAYLEALDRLARESL
jgi:transcriptional regulator with XRE-family HTH domain